MKTREAVLTALETQAVISKPRPNPRIRRFLTAVHTLREWVRECMREWRGNAEMRAAGTPPSWGGPRAFPHTRR
jgi:hypothetical protein